MFMSIVEGDVDPDREDDLRSAWEQRPSEVDISPITEVAPGGVGSV
jgi:hypothetical protein